MSDELKPQVKKDCFGYSKEYNKCLALNETYCAFQYECKFYKTKKQMCVICGKSHGRMISCNECKANY